MGPRIKRWRKRRGMTQAELAAVIGVTVIHVANLESPDDAPHHRNPSLGTAEKIAKALRVPLSTLLGERRRR
jgi:HTH-type transcriptional regulator, cell division transcriptional repressor